MYNMFKGMICLHGMCMRLRELHEVEEILLVGQEQGQGKVSHLLAPSHFHLDVPNGVILVNVC